MTDLTPDEMQERITRGLKENAVRFYPKIIVYEGMAGWGAIRQTMLEALERLGWWRDAARWLPPADMDFDVAYRVLCAEVPPAPGMGHENMQPFIEGGYPDSEVWFEQFGSCPELRIEGEALVFHPAPMTPLQHVRFLKDRAEAFRMTALRSDASPDITESASSIARDWSKELRKSGARTICPAPLATSGDDPSAAEKSPGLKRDAGGLNKKGRTSIARLARPSCATCSLRAGDAQTPC